MDEIFSSMLALGFQVLTEGPSQVLLCRTGEGTLLYEAIENGEDPQPEEQAFLNTLVGKQITHVVSLLQNTTLDLPSSYFRSGLLKVCPGAESALVLLQTGSEPMPLPLSMFL